MYFSGVLIIIVFLARIIQTYSCMNYGFVEMGLLSDRICSRGSYEFIVCSPDTVPPYETILAVLWALLAFSVWMIRRKQEPTVHERISSTIDLHHSDSSFGNF